MKQTQLLGCLTQRFWVVIAGLFIFNPAFFRVIITQKIHRIWTQDLQNSFSFSWFQHCINYWWTHFVLLITTNGVYLLSFYILILQFFSIDLTFLRSLFSKQFTQWDEHFVIVLNRLYVLINFIQITKHANNFLKTMCTKLSNVFIYVPFVQTQQT